MDLLPKSEALNRILRMQSWMQDAAVDCVFILQNADQYYFAGTVQIGLFCAPAAGDPIYLVQKSPSRARMESPWERIVPMAGLSRAADILAAEGCRRPSRVGLEMDVLPVTYYQRFQELFPGAEFVDASGAIRKIRMIKSEYEIGLMRGAAGMLAKAFEEIPGWAHTGATELEVSARLEGFLRLQGHQGITRMRGFNHEVAYGTVSGGPASSHPTCFPGPVGFIGLYPAILNGASRRKLETGDSVMVDIVGGYGGYIADKTRIFAVGDLNRDMCEAHEFVLAMNREIESMLTSGTACSTIYQHAMDRVKESPYATSFMGAGDSQVRFVGHGVGLELDEWPVLSSGFETPLEPGMTVAIEPKIFFPEHGGVGIENTYLITERGFENLTRYREEIVRLPR
jgi:Xaa-Pro dipeptidase